MYISRMIETERHWTVFVCDVSIFIVRYYVEIREKSTAMKILEMIQWRKWNDFIFFYLFMNQGWDIYIYN